VYQLPLYVPSKEQNKRQKKFRTTEHCSWSKTRKNNKKRNISKIFVHSECQLTMLFSCCIAGREKFENFPAKKKLKVCRVTYKILMRHYCAIATFSVLFFAGFWKIIIKKKNWNKKNVEITTNSRYIISWIDQSFVI